MQIQLNEKAEWPGVVAEVLQVLLRNGSREYLIEKHAPTTIGSGACLFDSGDDGCIFEYQSPNYVKKKHKNQDYWWVNDHHCSVIDVDLTSNRSYVENMKNILESDY